MRVFLLTLLAFVLAAPACAQEKTTERFVPIQALTGASGIPIWLVEDHSLPILSVRFAFKGAGARHETPEKQGTFQLLSNTLDEGAADFSAQQFQKILADESISLSFSSSKDHFSGQIYTLSARQDMAFDLLRQALTSPRFEMEAIARMRSANQTRIRDSLSDPEWKAARIMNDVYFGTHPYGLNSGGTLTTLARLSAGDLRAALRTHLTRDRLMVAMTGDITPDEARALVDKTFGKLPESANKDTIPVAQPPVAQQVHLTADNPQTVLLLQGPGLDRNDPDYEAAMVANMIFGGGGFGSRLTEEIREKRGLTYGISSGLMDQEFSDSFSISASTKAEQVQKVLALIRTEQEKMINAPVSAQELDDAKAYLIGSMPLALTSSQEISGLLLGQMLDARPVDDLDTRAAKIQAVTAQDVQRVSAKFLDPSHFTTVIVGPKPEGVENLKTLTKIPNAE